eukprot:4205984-Pleurochrysis_carterae.AAC.1
MSVVMRCCTPGRACVHAFVRVGGVSADRAGGLEHGLQTGSVVVIVKGEPFLQQSLCVSA